MLYWLDIETTGLDPDKGSILEIAIARAPENAPFELTHIFQQVISIPRAFLHWLDSYVLAMHEKTGLWAECLNSRHEAEEIEDAILKLIPANEPATLAGSSVHFDLSWLRRHMPRLASRFHYRVMDVSALALFAESVGMPKPEKKEPAHRAKADIESSAAFGKRVLEWLRAPQA